MSKLPVRQRVGRPTKAVSMERTRECAAMLLLCKPRSEIIDYFCDKYGLQESSVPNIITNAYKYIAETHKIDKDGTVSINIQILYDNINRAASLGDSRGVAQSVEIINKMLGIYKPEIQVSNNTLNLNLKDATLQDLKALLKDNN